MSFCLSCLGMGHCTDYYPEERVLQDGGVNGVSLGVY